MSEENSKKYGLGRPWPRRRFCEHTVDDLAIEVVGQHWTSEAISLSTEDWEVGRVPSSCHLSTDLFVSRNEECVQGELRVSGFPSLSVFREPKKVSGRIVISSRAFLSPWTGRGRFIPLSSWLSPKFPSGWLNFNNFHQVQRMIGGLGNQRVVLDLFSNF